MQSEPLTLPPQVARRFLLGRQGLWPGRRFEGPAGTVQAMRLVEHLQLDPLTMITRSQDLMLHSRVFGYTEEGWQQPAYRERGFFDWGGWLALRPMEELPFYRYKMLELARAGKAHQWAEANAALLDEMRATVREVGPVRNRDFAIEGRTRVSSYRGRKDSSVALYHLWRTGELMVHDRERFERVYDLAERIAPAGQLRAAGRDAALRFLVLKNTAFLGMADTVRPYFELPDPAHRDQGAAIRQELLEEGLLLNARIERKRKAYHILASDLPLIEALLAGRTPAEWTPLGPDTLEEVTFLAPLDPVSARGRALQFFDFHYTWEVYTPAEKRRWGYYTLPILWGDRLVARADMKFDRGSGALIVLGFWLEDPATGKDDDFGVALGRGLARLQRFLGARRLDAKSILPLVLRNAAVKAARESPAQPS